jgi:DmsE family decaheme c-type cytochrome
MKLLRLAWIPVVLALVCVVVAGRAQARQEANAAPASPAPVAAWSVGDCQACHEKATGPAFARTKHSQADQSCENCHQNVGEHAQAQAEGRSDGPDPSLKKLTASSVNARCLTCHEKDQQANWHSSMHDRRNVACTSCHSVHSSRSAQALLQTTTSSDTCFGCHKSERAKSLRTSHHPVREGKMGCTSCHNPHDGSNPKQLRADSTNELCYTCHTEKRGPFLHEHAPVREDCTACHDPHGSNHERLLVAKQPFLCQRCHFSGHGITADNASSLEGLPVAPPGATVTRSSRNTERGCKTCHLNIHGSNSPSGAFFVR